MTDSPVFTRWCDDGRRTMHGAPPRAETCLAAPDKIYDVILQALARLE